MYIVQLRTISPLQANAVEPLCHVSTEYSHGNEINSHGNADDLEWGHVPDTEDTLRKADTAPLVAEGAASKASILAKRGEDSSTTRTTKNK